MNKVNTREVGKLITINLHKTNPNKMTTQKCKLQLWKRRSRRLDTGYGTLHKTIVYNT